MPEENEKENPLKNNDEVKQPLEAEYLAIAGVAPVRTVEMPVDAPKQKSLTESMDDATDLTDMQFAASHLFPKVVSTNDVMIGRIAPEAFLSLLQMMVTDEIMTFVPTKEKPVFNTNKSITENYVRLTIGLEGRGRIDYAELIGAAREIKKEESLLKGL